MRPTKIALILLLATACTPTPQSIRDDLRQVQLDLAALAPVADIAEAATGNAELIPLTNAVAAAVQAANAVTTPAK